MASKWTVRPETVKIDLVYEGTLEDGTAFQEPFWITLKKRLTVGEARKAMTAGWRSASFGRKDGEVQTGTEVTIDWQRNSFARTEAYLQDWSLMDDANNKLDPKNRDVIESLDPAVYQIVEDAITKHVEAADREKKASSGSSSPGATSPS